jgi:hypothetical protein
MLIGIVVVCALTQVRNGLMLALVRLRGERVFQQQLDLGSSVAKLALVGLLSLTLLNATLALAVNLVVAGALWWRLRRWGRLHLARVQATQGQHRAPLLALVRRQTPNSLYYCLSGQIAVWLVAALGTTQGVAEVGALGRLAVVFAVIGAVVTAIVQPYFARHHDPQRLHAAYWAVNGFFVLLTAALLTASLSAPQPILWILGGPYTELQAALVWMVLGSSLSAWSSAIYSIGAARGWVVPSAWVIGSGLAGIGASVLWLDLSTPIGSFMLGSVSAALALTATLTHVTYQLHRHAQQRRGGGLA